MKSKSMPKRSSSHRKEDKSQREFEELIDPFFVTGWNKKDYGIDAVVEITSDLNNLGDTDVLSKCFLIQLKATEKLLIRGQSFSFSLPVKKIIYWLNYNLPVLLVIYEISTHSFYYRWIDDFLISYLDATNPNWGDQKTTIVKINSNSKFEKTTLQNIREYVSTWKMPARRTLESGKYFELRDKAYFLISKYRQISQHFKFESIEEIIKKSEEDIDQSIYRVAITGISRVGKSSLINALLKKEISPTGFFQTTGVPIQIIPGHKNEITVYFKSGERKNFNFNFETIKEYASQVLNEDNKKQVAQVTVSIKNRELERGVSLFDIPGLDDPSDEILEYAWQTVKKVNAIIYVIDASTAQDGGYVFRNEYKKHIDAFGRSHDKIFLVFNKIDRLPPEIMTLLKERVPKDLERFGLLNVINDQTFFLSAENKQSVQGADTTEQLNNALWNYILNENKSGIVKLSLLNQELYKSTKAFTQILNARLLNNENRIRLVNSIDAIKKKIPLLNSAFKERIQTGRASLFHSLDNKKNLTLLNLENILHAFAINVPLANSQEIKRFLSENLNNSLELLNNEYALQISQLKSFIDNWIEDNLKQVREILKSSTESKIIDFTEIETFEAPQIDLSSAWGMGFIAAAAGLFFSPAYAITAGLIGFFGNLFTTIESRRANQITKILARSREKYEEAFIKIKAAYKELMFEHSDLLRLYMSKKLDLYFNDLHNQLAKFEKPVKAEEIQLYSIAQRNVEELQNILTEFDSELRSFHFAK